MFIFILIICIAACAALYYAYQIEPNKLSVTNLSFYDEKIEDTPIKIALFSDTHFSDSYTSEKFDNVIEAINKEKPDIILFAGDLLDDLDKYTGDVTLISQKLSEINAPYGKFAVFGNHDYSGSSEFDYPEILSNGGFTLLKNEIYSFDNANLSLVSIDDCLIGYGDPSIAAHTDQTRYNLILCHEPDVADTLVSQGYSFDLMFSGHTHGGQVSLPVLSNYILPRLGREYVKGLHQLDNDAELYVTRGLGTTLLPLRLRSVPEICFITLYPLDSDL